MALFTPARRAFGGIVDVLGLRQDAAVLTKIDLSAAIPTFQLRDLLQAGIARHVSLIVHQTDGAGGASVSDLMDVHTAADWNEAIVGNQVVTPAFGVPPPENEALIYNVGISSTAAANLTSAEIFKDIATGTGVIRTALAFGDTSLSAGQVVRNATHDSPILMPLPWWIPIPAVRLEGMQRRTITTNAITVTINVSLVHAPVGVLQRFF